MDTEQQELLNILSDFVYIMGFKAIANDIKEGRDVKENLQLALNGYKHKFGDLGCSKDFEIKFNNLIDLL